MRYRPAKALVLCTLAVAAAAPATAQVLELVTRDLQDPVPAGGSIRYTFQYTYAGGRPATQVTLIDPLPPNTTFEWVDPSGTYDAGTNTVTWNIGTLQAGMTDQKSLQLGASGALPHGALILNSATLTSAETAPIVASQQTTISNSPFVYFTQLAEPSVLAGSELDITLAYSNGFGGTNILPATNVVVRNTFSPNATFISASDGGTYDSNTHTVTWNLGTLDVRETGELTLRLKAAAPVPPNSWISNGARLTGEPGVSVTSSSYVKVLGDPDLPTLTESGILAFAALIAGAGLLLVRRRKAAANA